MFTKLFKEIYSKMLSNSKVHPVQNDEELEEALQNYIMRVMGYSIVCEYRRCMKTDPSSFPYYAPVRRWFINLVQNFDNNKSRTMLDAIDEYGRDFYDKISEYQYVDALIKGIQKFYSPNGYNPNIIIEHKDKMYKIFLVDDKQIEGMPVLVINNIESLNDILRTYIETIVSSDNYYKNIFIDSCDDDKEKMSALLMWTIINISNEDALDLERYFTKYTSFLMDDTFNNFKAHPLKMGELLDDDLFLKFVKANYAYETPFYLAFMMCHQRVELPNMRIGIEDNGEEKIGHILSIQTTQAHPNQDFDPIINKEIRDALPKSPYFREFNPSHLLSLVLTLGLLNGAGINKINAYEYLPMRYQRFVNEERKNTDELNDYQHRLTNKFINTFFRLMEFTDGIEIISYPENGCTFSFRIKKDIRFNNELLDKAYQIGYNQKDNLINIYDELKTLNKKQI